MGQMTDCFHLSEKNPRLTYELACTSIDHCISK